MGRHGLTIWLTAFLFVLCLGGKVAGQEALSIERGRSRQVKLPQVEVKPGGMGILTIRAAAVGADWAEEGAESAVMEVRIGDVTTGHIVLFMGKESFDYKMLIDGFAEPEPVFLIGVDENLTPPGIQEVVIEFIGYEAVGPDDPRYRALIHAPILYGREVNNLSDVPLYSWVETTEADEGEIFKYNVIWSNEDGGTDTIALLARWGRTVDIEWIDQVTIDYSGMVVEEIFQGPEHKTLDFSGEYEGLRPVYRTCTDNNMVCDDGVSSMKFSLAPEFRNLDTTREVILDDNPWIVETAFKELVREGKVGDRKKDYIPSVQDPRRYLYMDWEILNPISDRVMVLCAKVRDNKRWYRHDWRIENLRITRSGWGRSAILLPEGTGPGDIEAVKVIADTDKNLTLLPLKVKYLRAVFLDQNFSPIVIELQGFEPFELNQPKASKEFAAGYAESPE